MSIKEMTQMQELTHIAFFAGIGSDSLAAEWAGFETVLHCEIDPDCQKILKYYWPNVTLIEDVRNVTKEAVINSFCKPGWAFTKTGMGMEGDLLQETRWDKGANRLATSGIQHGAGNGNFELTLLTAGVPCQPASVAGKRKGKADDRWLWPEALRVLNEFKPAWCCFENPVGIASLVESGGLPDMESTVFESLPDRAAVELDNICRDIEAQGYEVQPVCIPACAVNAPHRRDRIFIIGYAGRCGCEGNTRRRSVQEFENGYMELETPDIANTQAEGLEGANATRCVCPNGQPSELLCHATKQGLPDWAGGNIPMPNPLTFSESKQGKCKQSIVPKGELQGESGRSNSKDTSKSKRSFIESFRYLDDGAADRLVRLTSRERIVRLKQLGNANPPQLYFPIYKAIAEYEKCRQ